LTDKVWPVQARRAERWVTIQSTVPLRWITDIEVMGLFVEIKAVIGVADEMRW
jgi:hypothetical protein